MRSKFYVRIFPGKCCGKRPQRDGHKYGSKDEGDHNVYRAIWYKKSTARLFTYFSKNANFTTFEDEATSFKITKSLHTSSTRRYVNFYAIFVIERSGNSNMKCSI